MDAKHIFRFKQFQVCHEQSAMKVGTDAVLLGAWCDVGPSTHQVLDVGTGCGVITLMIAQRSTYAHILAIDIDKQAAAEAQENALRSPWSDRITVRCADFNTLPPANTAFDLIVCNPPFFSNSLLPPEQSRGLARHDLTLTYRQLLCGCTTMLEKEGKLAIITPADVKSEIEAYAHEATLSVRRCTEVLPIESKKAKRLLWEFSPTAISREDNCLTIAHADGSFTDEYVALTRAFYLKM